MKNILLSFIIFLLAHSVFAQGNYEKRDANQDNRIQQGVDSGQLNAQEAAKLEKQENHIHDAKEKMEASGDGINAREQKRLNRMQNRESKRIYRKKHNKKN